MQALENKFIASNSPETLSFFLILSLPVWTSYFNIFSVDALRLVPTSYNAASTFGYWFRYAEHVKKIAFPHEPAQEIVVK